MTGRPPDDLDRLIGRNIRTYRLSRGLTQTELGRAIGVTFQQIQKYENARNRINAARLCRLAQALQVPVDVLFAEGHCSTVQLVPKFQISIARSFFRRRSQ